MSRPRRTDGTFESVDVWDRLAAKRSVEGECWVWTGAVRAYGANGRGEPYGGIRYEGKVWLVHRLAYTLAHGPIPSGLVIDHKCRRTMCFRPDHLRAVTSRENAHGRDPKAVAEVLTRALAKRWGRV